VLYYRYRVVDPGDTCCAPASVSVALLLPVLPQTVSVTHSTIIIIVVIIIIIVIITIIVMFNCFCIF